MFGILPLVLASFLWQAGAQTEQDPSQPLLLTPYIEAGLFEDAVELAKVTDPVFSRVESYSGLITVNKTYNSNTFFWFFPALNGDENAPIILNLAGGPGQSIIGIIFVYGPYAVQQNLSLELRNTSWGQNNSLLYIDNPIGTGFSFTDNLEGIETSSTQCANTIYQFLNQFFLLFPSYLKNDFYVWGLSYGGHYAPAVARKIHEENSAENASTKINLKGIAVESGWTDPIRQFRFGNNLYQLGFLNDSSLQLFISVENSIEALILEGQYLKAMEMWVGLVLDANSTLVSTTGLSYGNIAGNYLVDANYNLQYVAMVERIAQFLSQPQVRQGFHVGSNNVSFGNDTVLEKMLGDFMVSYKEDVELLLQFDYRVLYYGGQTDLISHFRGVENMLADLEWKGNEGYGLNPRIPWVVNDSVVGYAKYGGALNYVFVRNAGHLLTYDQPVLSALIMNNFIRGVALME